MPICGALQVPAGYESGNFVGPTVLFGVDGKNRAYTEEIFGPVLVCLGVDTLEEAIAFTNGNKYGNGCAIFTQSGAAARKFQHEVSEQGKQGRQAKLCGAVLIVWYIVVLIAL